jgi:glycosyltransferase involved in cell wall biosynthesis
MNIVYLYAELQPYVIVIFKEFLKHGNITVHAVSWDKNNLTPYIPPQIQNVYYYKRSKFRSSKELYNKVASLNPSIIYTSGWMDKMYMRVCMNIRKRLSIPVVAGSDTQWRGGRQWLNVLAAPILHKKCFSHIQISGIWQYEYARRLGFSRHNILMHNLSADVGLFGKIDICSKEKDYPRRMLYMGRFSPEKGLPHLIEAWNSIGDKKSWILTLIGAGPDKEKIIHNKIPRRGTNKDIEVLDFMDQESLSKYMQNAGCFILPSVFEPWALVLHEAAAGGLPILASKACGAAPYFVIDNYNGFTFEPKNHIALRHAIEKIITGSTESLIKMSHNSRKLSCRITPEIVAETFLSAVCQ